ncbi:Homeobox-containing protein 1 [Galemys pyrenaicus]|uniref:Homeobox-containing protein 1 n=1 Tax=Galemys pyrenaicus TaxID=202257 RepID=A0A8J5ZSR0_GALPY|nr:Homeobox-containing protein 1 [Galemys pyrenaicus]
MKVRFRRAGQRERPAAVWEQSNSGHVLSLNPGALGKGVKPPWDKVLKWESEAGGHVKDGTQRAQGGEASCDRARQGGRVATMQQLGGPQQEPVGGGEGRCGFTGAQTASVLHSRCPPTSAERREEGWESRSPGEGARTSQATISTPEVSEAAILESHGIDVQSPGGHSNSDDVDGNDYSEQDDSTSHSDHQDPISLAVEMAAVNHTILALARQGANEIKTEALEDD